MCPRNAKWTNGRSIRSGTWVYIKHKDKFLITLDSGRQFYTSLDTPEWGNWSLIRNGQ